MSFETLAMRLAERFAYVQAHWRLFLAVARLRGWNSGLGWRALPQHPSSIGPNVLWEKGFVFLAASERDTPADARPADALPEELGMDPPLLHARVRLLNEQTLKLIYNERTNEYMLMHEQVAYRNFDALIARLQRTRASNTISDSSCNVL